MNEIKVVTNSNDKGYTRSWREVSNSSPCPICGHGSWCSISSDRQWAMCRRVHTEQGHAKIDKAGIEYWIYGLTNNSNPDRLTPELPDEAQSPRADAATLSKVYAVVLDALTLSEPHKENLRRRGLTDCEISLRGYKTMMATGRKHLADTAIAAGLLELLPGVPGFNTGENSGATDWFFGGDTGLLIPVRDIEQNIVALKVRRDEAVDGPKYRYVSSSSHNGPGPGCPVHVPFGPRDGKTVRITEGELKADIATALTGMLTFGLPGVSVFRPAIELLKKLSVTTVRLSFDADAKRNYYVALALKNCAQILAENGFNLEMEVWNE
jgi:hypothetical protein